MNIAGPCSAESETQILETAKFLSKFKSIDYFRAGIWKPRTGPNSFQGVGEVGLSWLKKAKELYGIKLATEVARPSHIDAVLKNDIDLVWVGARTTINPFLVEELATALAGTHIQVFVKNPIAPDLGTWLGAVERFKKKNINNIGAIHRGFSHFNESIYRNHPYWEIPLSFRCEAPEIPLLCDPSHISGNSENIFEVFQTALELNLDGYMVEVHPIPQKALSDSAQQLSFEQFELFLKAITDNLLIASPEDKINELEELRLQIDSIDQEIIKAFYHRNKLVKAIDRCKSKYNLTPLQLKRWNEIKKKNEVEAESLGLNPKFINKVFDLIHYESIRIQSETKRIQ